MNWEVIATLAEVIAAIGVIASLIYVAQQVQSSQVTAADANRLSRVEGVCDMLLSCATNDDLRQSFIEVNGLVAAYKQMASDLDISVEDAMRSDFAHAYWFWLHWGQFSSTTDANDLEVLKLVIRPYLARGMNYSWEHSFLAKPLFDENFIGFVESTIAEHRQEDNNARNNPRALFVDP